VARAKRLALFLGDDVGRLLGDDRVEAVGYIGSN
jgi:hypothetical protein